MGSVNRGNEKGLIIPKDLTGIPSVPGVFFDSIFFKLSSLSLAVSSSSQTLISSSFIAN